MSDAHPGNSLAALAMGRSADADAAGSIGQTIAPPRARGRWPAQICLSVAIGVATAVLVAKFSSHAVPVSDFDQCLVAARALLNGANPYSVIGPGRAFDWPWLYYYPLTAAVAAMPFAVLNDVAARATFLGIASGLLVLAAVREERHRLFVFMSAGFLSNVLHVQWSPLLVAGALMPTLALVLAAKPTIGLALYLAFPSKQAIIGGVMLVLVSLWLMPAWPVSWLGAIQHAPNIRAPLQYPGGALILLALLRWRRPEARLLAALACIPHSVLFYETIPLFLVPSSRRQSIVLAALSWAALLFMLTVGPDPTSAAFFVQSSWVIIALLYLPCVMMVLRRPNEGTLPAWVERSLRRARMRPLATPNA